MIVTTKNIPLSKILRQVIREEKVVEDKEYPVLGIHWYAKGLYIKYVKKGHEIKAKKLYVVRKGDFVYSRLFAWKGSFALVPVELDGCYVSDEFPCFEVDESKINPRYLMYFFTNEKLWEQSLELSEGSTGISRNRLKVDKFLSFEIPLPSLEIQNKVVEKLDLTVNLLKRLDDLKEEFNNDLFALKNQILHEAVQGKLVEQDPRDEPATVLLKRIREEKERLIKENKIKKEKPLPPISPEEIPYELPKGWEWVRLGEITSVQGGKRVPKGYTLLDEPTDHVYIRVSDMKNGTIVTSDLKYISDEVYEIIKDYTISKDDLYITIAGTIGQVGTVPDELDGMNLTENAAKIIVVLINKHYLKYVLSSNLLQQQFVDKVNQVAQPKLALKRIKMAVIPLPPINEQLRIVNKIEEMLYAAELLEKHYVDVAQEYKRLMQVMLAEAFQNRSS